MNKREIRQMCFLCCLMFSVLFFGFGCVRGFTEENRSCKYQSIGSYINIPYRIGCELTVERWK